MAANITINHMKTPKTPYLPIGGLFNTNNGGIHPFGRRTQHKFYRSVFLESVQPSCTYKV